MAAAERKFKHELEPVIKDVDSLHSYFEEKWAMVAAMNPTVRHRCFCQHCLSATIGFYEGFAL